MYLAWLTPAELNLLHVWLGLKYGVSSNFTGVTGKSLAQYGLAWCMAESSRKLSCPLSVREKEIHFSRSGEVASGSAVTISIKGLRMVIMFTYQQSD